MPNIADDILATLQRIETLLKKQAINAKGICGETATIKHSLSSADFLVLRQHSLSYDKYLGMGKSDKSIEVIECTLPINHEGSCNHKGWCFIPGQQINNATGYNR